MKESEDAGEKETTYEPPAEKTEQQNNNQQSTINLPVPCSCW